MGCRILEGYNGACFYDSVTETCFGKLMEDSDEAEKFMKWVCVDLRNITDDNFETKLNEFRELNKKTPDELEMD